MACIILCNFAAIFPWIYFRSDNFQSANHIIMAMFGVGESGVSQQYSNLIIKNGLYDFISQLTQNPPNHLVVTGLLFVVISLFVWIAPNACQLVGIIENRGKIRWVPSWRWALVTALLFACSVAGMFSVKPFIYFQF